MKAAVWASLKDSGWVNRIPWILLGLRWASKEDLQSSSAKLVYGQPLRVPKDFVPNTTTPWSAAQQWAALLDGAKVFALILHQAWPPTAPHLCQSVVGRICVCLI